MMVIAFNVDGMLSDNINIWNDSLHICLKNDLFF